MSDYIRKSTLIEALKQEIRLITPIEENHDMFYHDSGYNCAMVGARLLVENQPTLDEKEIIRKAFERVVERLEDKKWGTSEWRDKWRDEIIGECIEVVKEEGGIE
jgi:hypothetical protein